MNLFEMIKEDFEGKNLSVILTNSEAAELAYSLYMNDEPIYEESDNELIATLSNNEVVVVSRNHYWVDKEEWFVEPLYVNGKQLYNDSDVFLIREGVVQHVELDKLLNGDIIIIEDYYEDYMCDLLCEEFDDECYDDEEDDEEYFFETYNYEDSDYDDWDMYYYDEEDNYDEYEESEHYDYDVCEDCYCDECEGCFFDKDDEEEIEEMIENEEFVAEIIEDLIEALEDEDSCAYCAIEEAINEAYTLGYLSAVIDCAE